MFSNSDERLAEAFYVDNRVRPDTTVIITKAMLRDTLVLHLTITDIFEVELWASRPSAGLDESVFGNIIAATSAIEAVGRLRGLIRVAMRDCGRVAAGLKSLEGGTTYGDLLDDQRNKTILYSAHDLTTLSRTRAQGDILNCAHSLRFPPSYVLVESNCKGLAIFDVIYLFNSRLHGLDDKLNAFDAVKVMTRHFGESNLSLLHDPEHMGSFLPAVGDGTWPVGWPHTRMTDLRVVGNDQLLVQMAGQQLWECSG